MLKRDFTNGADVTHAPNSVWYRCRRARAIEHHEIIQNGPSDLNIVWALANRGNSGLLRLRSQ
jgi:hypothetical protein